MATDGSRMQEFIPDPSVCVLRLAKFTRLLSARELLLWEQMYFSLLGELIDVCAQFRPDVIFSNGLETAVLGRMVADALDVPLASNFHEHEPENDPGGLGKLRLVYGRLRPELVLAGSRMYEERALRFGPSDHVRLVPHGIDVERFAGARRSREQTRAEWGVSSDARVFLCPGRFKQRKGQIYALQAFAKIASSGDVLILVGSTSSGSEKYRDELMAAASGLQAGRVVVDEHRGPNDMAAVYGAADYVVLSSLSEGLGFTLLEAMASGVPTVATDIAGFREVLSDSELVPLVSAADSDALAMAIEDLVRGDGNEQLARVRAARERITERFSLQAMGANTDHLLRLLIERWVSRT